MDRRRSLTMLAGVAMLGMAALMLVILAMMMVEFAPGVFERAEDGLPLLEKVAVGTWIVFGVVGWLAGTIATGISGWNLIRQNGG